MDCRILGFLVLHHRLEFVQTHVHWVGDAIQPFHPLSPSSPSALSLFQQGLFQSVSSSHQMVKVLELQHQSFQWIFRVDFLGIGWFELLGCPRDSQESSPAVQFKNINSLVQLSYSYMPTGKTLALTRWTFVSKVMSLLFNILSRFVIAFLPRSKRLLISWLLSLSKVILEPKKIKFVTASTFSPSIYHEVMG